MALMCGSLKDMFRYLFLKTRLMLPNRKGCMQNGISVEIYARCMHIFFTFGSDLDAQSVLSNKIFASELTRKFIKGALLVGYRNMFV